jgi:chromosome segregation ATPase
MGAVAGGLTGGLGGEVLRRGKLLGQATATAKSLRNRADGLGEQVGSLESRNSALDADLSRMAAQHESSLGDLRRAEDLIDRHNNAYTRLEQEADDALSQVKRLNNELGIRDDVIQSFKIHNKGMEEQLGWELERRIRQRLLHRAMISGLTPEGISLNQIRKHIERELPDHIDIDSDQYLDFFKNYDYSRFT